MTPNRHDRRRAWALVPRAIRATAPASTWLPPRARALLTRTIARRNTLDRALAEARGLDPSDPACARFTERGRDLLDRQVRANARAGA